MLSVLLRRKRVAERRKKYVCERYTSRYSSQFSKFDDLLL